MYVGACSKRSNPIRLKFDTEFCNIKPNNFQAVRLFLLAILSSIGYYEVLHFMISYNMLGPTMPFGPIRKKLTDLGWIKLTHCVPKILHDQLSNVSKINCTTPIGRTEFRSITMLV